MKRVLILRGIQGSGKSTYARSLPDATVVSADDFFLSPSGRYEYDRERIQDAHTACFLRFMRALVEEAKTVVVDNMNLEAWEIAPYYMTGTAFDYEVEIINFFTDIETSAARNIHSVPKKDIERAAKRLKSAKLPAHYKQSIFHSASFTPLPATSTINS